MNEASEGDAGMSGKRDVPMLMTAEEVAELLRTTRIAVYAMAQRGQLPGVTRIGRRILFHSADLMDWLNQKRTATTTNPRNRS